VLAYISSVMTLACGVGLVWRRTAAAASLVLLVSLLAWMIAFKLPVIFRHLTVEVAYQNWGEHAVITAAAWVLYAWFATDWEKRRLGFITGDAGVRIARVFYGLAMIAFGFSHFVYLDNTAPLVPAWLPAHAGWAYFTGGAYLAAGVGILSGAFARLAAVLSAVMIGLFLILVWGPFVAAGHMSAMHQQETIVSAALTAAAWVVADSYRGAPWLALRLPSGSASPAAAPSGP
jgi:uncharacterized membrane protein